MLRPRFVGVANALLRSACPLARRSAFGETRAMGRIAAPDTILSRSAALSWPRSCSTAANAVVQQPHVTPGEFPSVADDTAQSKAADDTAAAGTEAPPEGPLRFTSDMRPAKNTSRKWVKLDELGRAYATGRRKMAVARVWVWPVRGPDELPTVRINKMNLSQFFGGHWEQRFMVLAPLLETGTSDKYSVMATVKGGGTTGQAEAVRLGIATALQGHDASLRPKMKEVGYLKRDPRQRERKKPGQKGARKKFAWVKR